MPLALAHRISMHYGGPLLLEHVSLKVEPGDRIGLVGRNGCGKSTLLKLITGELDPTEGQIVIPRGIRIAHQAQELDIDADVTVLDAMRHVFREATGREERLRGLEESIARAADEEGRRRLLAEYERLAEAQARAGVYDIDQRIRSMLQSLGLAEKTWSQPVGQFSGGERNVIGLARALLSEPDLMLLDEPSNHLDMDGVEWFIDFLRKSKTAFVMVSHNRHLLDATVDTIWEHEGKKITAWTGSYGDFQRQKAEARALQERQFKVQQRLIKRIEFQARRLMDMANAYDDPGQAKRAKAMIKRVDRMDKIEAPVGQGASFAGRIQSAGRHGRIALEIDDFSYAIGDRPLFEGANLEIEFGDRVCLVGPNGSGKSTLFKQILTKGGWENPVLRLGKSVRVGEYRQLFDDLDAARSLLDWAADLTGGRERDAADLLHRFLFTHEDLPRPIGTLSGGEKSRLQLARLAHQKVNFLLLDEPTNHLDIPSCELLEEMLLEFQGTLLVISHDRYFLDRLVTRVVELEDRQLVDHPTGFADWWHAHKARMRQTALEDRRPERSKARAREAFEARRSAQRAVQKKARNIERLEREIQEAEKEREEVRTALERAFAPGGDPTVGAELAARGEALELRLEALFAEWTEAADEP